MRTRDEWRNMLEETLPPPHQHIARNQAITAYYASWYLQRPQLFKWSGMAAFVSSQIGLGLRASLPFSAPYDLVAREVQIDGGILGAGMMLSGLAFKLALAVPIALHDYAARQILLNDLDVIREGNNAIFDDIGWAHLAYMHDGIKGIEANVSEAEREFMLGGFQMIDEGARMLDRPAECERGKRLIRNGNIYVLMHEQMNAAQSAFDRVTDLGKLITSLGSVLNFPRGLDSGATVWPSFGGHFGYLSTVARQRRLENFDDRLEWFEGDLLPVWEKLDGAYCENAPLHHRLVALARYVPKPALA